MDHSCTCNACGVLGQAVALLLVPHAIKGGLLHGHLIERIPVGDSYYEALDVMIKDVVGDVRRDGASDSREVVRSCHCMDYDREKEVKMMMTNNRYLTACTIIIILIGGAYGLRESWIHQANLRTDNRLLGLIIIPCVVMVILALLLITTTIQVC